MSSRDWRHGNDLELLENGEAFFPRVFDDIAAAKHEVIIETFIWFDDRVGRALRDVLVDAAARGVKVDITVDGYGSAPLGKDFVASLTEAGIRLHVFGPLPPILGVQANLFRRLHRKLVVVDQRVAYVGGINYSDEHMRYYGDKSK
ncbi:MAG: cardiolipin synthase B, partial [Gammaproteobacteria bacterium]|nr:cardiolipin synthase B [Gammaproteobacteria bacterium]